MKSCPICRNLPRWHYASHLTAKHNVGVENRNKWTRYFFWSGGCAHADDFGKTLGVVAEAEQKGVEDRWDARAEEIFAAYTKARPWSEGQISLWKKNHPNTSLPDSAKGWTDAQRAAFRAAVWPEPPKPIPEMFDRYRDEAPTANSP